MMLHPRLDMWERRIILLAQAHLVLSILLFVLASSAVWGSVMRVKQSSPRSSDELGQLISEFVVAPVIGALGLIVAVYVAAMALLLHVAGWALLKRARWASPLTISVWWILAVPLAPVALVTLLPGNWSSATLLFSASVIPAPIVTFFLLLRPVQDVFAYREFDAEKKYAMAPAPDVVQIRGRAERARDRAAARQTPMPPPRID